MTRGYVIQNGKPLPELLDTQFTPNKRAILLHVKNGEKQYVQRLDLRRSGSGLTMVNELYGTVAFGRGLKRIPAQPKPPFMHVIRNTVGHYTTSRKLAEALVFLMWGEEVSFPRWPDAAMEEVRALPVPQAAD